MGIMDLGGIFSPSGQSGNIEAAAGGAATNAGHASDFANWLSGLVKGNQGTSNELQNTGVNTFMQMLQGKDPLGNVSGGIGGVNQNYLNAKNNIAANFAGDGSTGSGFMQDALARNEMGRASEISNLQAQGKQGGLQGLMSILDSIKRETQGYISGTNQGYGTSNQGYGTAIGGYGQAAQAENAGVQNFLDLVKSGSAAAGAYYGAGGGGMNPVNGGMNPMMNGAPNQAAFFGG